MSTNTPQPDWATECARMFFDPEDWDSDNDYLNEQRANLIRQAAANHYLPELRMAEETLSGIIEGCVHPDTAVRRVMVDLAPIRAALSRIEALTQPTK